MLEGEAVEFDVDGELLEGTATFESPPVELTDATEPWPLVLPTDAITNPDAIHDLWVLVRYHVSTTT